MWPIRKISLDELKKLYERDPDSEEETRVHFEVIELVPTKERNASD